MQSFSATCTNYHYHMFTLQYPKCMRDLSQRAKGNTRWTKLLGGLNNETLQRHNNSYSILNGHHGRFLLNFFGNYTAYALGEWIRVSKHLRFILFRITTILTMPLMGLIDAKSFYLTNWQIVLTGKIMKFWNLLVLSRCQWAWTWSAVVWCSSKRVAIVTRSTLITVISNCVVLTGLSREFLHLDKTFWRFQTCSWSLATVFTSIQLFHYFLVKYKATYTDTL